MYSLSIRCSAIAERPRCRVHNFWPKVELGDNILWTLWVYLQPLWHNRPAKLSNSVKTKNQGYYAVQGDPRSSRSVPIESPYATSYLWLIVTDILVLFRSYRSLLFKFWTLCVFEPLWGLRDNVRCSSLAHSKARSGFPISVNWRFFAIGVTAEALRAPHRS